MNLANPAAAALRAQFRFYEELNDFLPAPQRKRSLDYRFQGHPGIKDPIEAFGVPHTEVDLIVINGEAVGFDYRLQDGDRVAVYPMFESVDISPLVRLRAKPLRRTAFVVDVNLGKLARRLRMLGFDTLYENRFEDAEIADIAAAQGRIVLTRDRRLLFAKRITHGYWIRSTDPRRQVDEVLIRLDLRNQIRPFRHCIVCNGELQEVDKTAVWDQLEPKTKLHYRQFYQCDGCGKVFWEGSHVEDMRNRYLENGKT